MLLQRDAFCKTTIHLILRWQNEKPRMAMAHIRG